MEKIVDFPRGNLRIQEIKMADETGRILCTEDIQMLFPGGEKISFRKMIPVGWKLISFFDMFPNGITPMQQGVPYFRTYKTGSGAQNIIYGNLTHKGAVAALLHEIHHAQRDSSGITKKDICEGQDLLNEYIASFLFKNENGTFYINEEYIMFSIMIPPAGKDIENMTEDEIKLSLTSIPLPLAIIAEYGKRWARNEREAWAYSLNEIYKARKSGLDLEEGLSNDDLRNLAYTTLESYDIQFNTEMFKTGRKIYPFTKKIKFQRVDIDWLFSP